VDARRFSFVPPLGKACEQTMDKVAKTVKKRWVPGFTPRKSERSLFPAFDSGRAVQFRNEMRDT
jgi:hypothetical protein